MSSHIGKVLRKVKNKLDKTFIEPSRRVKRYQRDQDALNRAKLEAGEFNR